MTSDIRLQEKNLNAAECTNSLLLKLWSLKGNYKVRALPVNPSSTCISTTGLFNAKKYFVRCPNLYLSLVEGFLAYLSEHHKEEVIFKEH